MDLIIHQFDLALRYPFGISRHTYQSMETYIVELREGNISGFGEATTNPYYGVSADSLFNSFEIVNEAIETHNFRTPQELWSLLFHHLAHDPFALSAIDCAAHDLHGKMMGKSFRELHGLTVRKYPFTSYTLGIDKPDAVLKKARDLPWPIYKIKAGSTDDLETIKLLRKETQAVLRVDANGAWDLEDALDMLAVLKELNVEFVEQPLDAHNWTGANALFKKSPIPLTADESCRNELDINRCYGAFHGINIKLSKCGGITPAVQMIKLARKKGLKIMIGCMTESSIGISAAAQLLPLVDYADLDGPLLLAEDIARGLKYKKGFLKLGKGPGFGINFLQHKRKTDLPQ